MDLKNLIKNNIVEFICMAVIGIVLILSLIPVVRLGFHNYAIGDDYWYSAYTYQGFVHGGIIGAIKGSIRMLMEIYETWQGTWFTIVLFTLSPNNFIKNGYVLTIFISLGFLFLAYKIVLEYFLVKELDLPKNYYRTVLFLLFFLTIQYMPRTTSGIYWFNGVMHYTIPLLLSMIAIVRMKKFANKGKLKDLVAATICMALLGGSSYLAAIWGALIPFWFLFENIIINPSLKAALDKKTASAANPDGSKPSKARGKICLKINIQKEDWLFLVPWGLELAGLFISYKSPGNDIRSGEDMSFQFGFMKDCIISAIGRGNRDSALMLLGNPILILSLVFLAFFTFRVLNNKMSSENFKFTFPCPLLFWLVVNGTHWATFLPEIYARSDVSGGVANTHLQTTLFVSYATIVYFTGWIIRVVKEYRAKNNKPQLGSIFETAVCKNMVNVIALACLAVITIFWSFAPVKTTTSYCKELLGTEKLEIYEATRIEQDAILLEAAGQTGASNLVVEVPEYTEDMYPLCNMPLEESADGGHNIDRAKYYGLKGVTAYFR